jgi:hypothetical protein
MKTLFGSLPTLEDKIPMVVECFNEGYSIQRIAVVCLLQVSTVEKILDELTAPKPKETK